jgi:hypothetical protein
MSVDFLTGFEHGLAASNGGGLFDAISGTTLSTADVRTGSYNFDVAAAGGAYFVRKDHAARDHVVVRGYIFIDTLPAGGTRGQIHSILIGTSYGNIQIDSAGVVYASFRTSGHVLDGSEATGPTLSVGVHYRIEAHYDMSASPNVIHWRVNGVAQTDASFTNAARTCTNSNWGQVNTTATYSFKVDDWLQGNAALDYPFGGGKVIKILAGSDGTHSFTDNDFSTGEAGTQRAASYTDFNLMVDDAVPWTLTRSTTDNIAQRVVRTAGYVEIKPASTPESGTATAVRALLAYSSAATQANAGACLIRNSAGAEVEVWGLFGGGAADKDYSETSNQFKGAIATKPAAGWTPTEVNALVWRIGGSEDISPVPTWQALMLEVDYPAVVSAVFPNRNLAVIRR